MFLVQARFRYAISGPAGGLAASILEPEVPPEAQEVHTQAIGTVSS
jgi:hypothetical protein